MTSYKIIYNENFKPEAIWIITNNWPHSVSPMTIHPLSIDDTVDDIKITLQQLKDRETPQVQ